MKRAVNLHAIFTGDIVGSRAVAAEIWLPVLEKSIQRFTNRFEIFRGDSFQADIPMDRCFEFVFYLKSKIKNLGSLDVRLSLGVGEITYHNKFVNSSNGEAFVFSGEAFNNLKKRLFVVKSPWGSFDEMTNLIMDLTMEISDKWTLNMAEAIGVAIENPNANQAELALLLNRKYQSQVSTELNKANYSKVMNVIDYCTKELMKRC